jgi:uncharacterized integral membrane protein
MDKNHLEPETTLRVKHTYGVTPGWAVLWTCLLLGILALAIFAASENRNLSVQFLGWHSWHFDGSPILIGAVGAPESEWRNVGRCWEIGPIRIIQYRRTSSAGTGKQRRAR